MNPPQNHPAESIRAGEPNPLAPRAAFVLLLAAVALSLAQDIDHRFFSTGPNAKKNLIAGFDDYLRSSSAGQPVFIRFDHFDAAHGAFASTIYFRAVYCLYPTPVYVAPDNAVISASASLLAANFTPSDPWLTQHHIPRTIVFAIDPNGAMSENVVPTQALRRPLSQSGTATLVAVASAPTSSE